LHQREHNQRIPFKRSLPVSGTFSSSPSCPEGLSTRQLSTTSRVRGYIHRKGRNESMWRRGRTIKEAANERPYPVCPAVPPLPLTRSAQHTRGQSGRRQVTGITRLTSAAAGRKRREHETDHVRRERRGRCRRERAGEYRVIPSGYQKETPSRTKQIPASRKKERQRPRYQANAKIRCSSDTLKDHLIKNKESFDKVVKRKGVHAMMPFII